MKKTIFILVTAFLFSDATKAQNDYVQQITTAVAQLDKANSAKDYQQLAIDFETIAAQRKTDWLPWYYAAFCNAKTGWLFQDDGEKIEPFADKAEEEIKTAQSLVDTASQKKELSEIYCVKSMVNQARVFINPMSFGSQYGPVAGQYIQMAERMNSENPRAIYLEGWEKNATPKMWGGDKKKAKELLETAKQKLESDTSPGINPHWGMKEVDELLKQLK
jgi:hypothetical protein